eukprot:TRINITY_DN1912_c0_g1_i2.p1 TRINITY_DN1912_c0_g1~~TRINITY_DN1912_c0_g1_i2.p1  ORF type:complete len:628 (+),score=206.09 TRINITY_DN1912_c0_g1_i2:33-1916(+)
MVRHLLKISDLTKEELLKILNFAKVIKAHPERFNEALKDKTLLMLFEKPSLRTRVSFETGMTQMGGHGIFYSIATSPLGKKETFGDTGEVLSRMVDAVMGRCNRRQDIIELANHSTIPVINGLDDYAHPCQMLADMLTVMEVKGKCEGLKMCYFGDTQNNVTYDLMRVTAMLGMTFYVAGPEGDEYAIEQSVLDEVKQLCEMYGGKVVWTHDPIEAVTDADVIYTDSWMSYGIAKEEEERRRAALTPYQVTKELCAHAKPDYTFMNCLPAMRGAEQTAEVIDDRKHSIVFQEAENRLHAQKALLCFLLNPAVMETKKQRLLIALGGNALKSKGDRGTFEETMANCNATCTQIAEIVSSGFELTVTHGNGPQVGAILLQHAIASEQVPAQPMPVCGAESQGQIGYMLGQVLGNKLHEKGIHTQVATILTQTRVSDKDEAWSHPTKPIGSFYDEAHAKANPQFSWKEDAGRGWRRVVASPTPIEIIEADAINNLVAHDFVVIASGGGGIPVVRNEDGTLEGRDAVIDKDLSGELLAQMINADKYLILTDVEFACLHWQDKEKRVQLKDLSLAEAKALYEEGHFLAGSMGPKMRAAIKFVENTGREAIITSLHHALDAIEGKTGTHIRLN